MQEVVPFALCEKMDTVKRNSVPVQAVQASAEEEEVRQGGEKQFVIK
jgi:hypothetical protein